MHIFFVFVVVANLRIFPLGREKEEFKKAMSSAIIFAMPKSNKKNLAKSQSVLFHGKSQRCVVTGFVGDRHFFVFLNVCNTRGNIDTCFATAASTVHCNGLEVKTKQVADVRELRDSEQSTSPNVPDQAFYAGPLTICWRRVTRRKRWPQMRGMRVQTSRVHSRYNPTQSRWLVQIGETGWPEGRATYTPLRF